MSGTLPLQMSCTQEGTCPTRMQKQTPTKCAYTVSYVAGCPYQGAHHFTITTQPAALRAMVLAVRALVQGDTERNLTAQCMQAAQQHIKANPEGTLQRIVAHFQQLFDVPYVLG